MYKIRIKSYLSYLTEVLLFNRKRFNKCLNVGKDTLIFWRMLFQIYTLKLKCSINEFIISLE